MVLQRQGAGQQIILHLVAAKNSAALNECMANEKNETLVFADGENSRRAKADFQQLPLQIAWS
jgi:hypothetical protein